MFSWASVVSKGRLIRYLKLLATLLAVEEVRQVVELVVLWESLGAAETPKARRVMFDRNDVFIVSASPSCIVVFSWMLMRDVLPEIVQRRKKKCVRRRNIEHGHASTGIATTMQGIRSVISYNHSSLANLNPIVVITALIKESGVVFTIGTKGASTAEVSVDWLCKPLKQSNSSTTENLLY